MGTEPRFDLVTAYYRLSIESLVRQGCFPEKHISGNIKWPNGNSVGISVNGDYVVFSYSCNGESIQAQVHTDMTRTNFGGRRRWYICPECGRRRGVMYFARRGVACRACLRLVYPTTRAKAFDRAIDKRDRLFRSLGAKPSDDIYFLSRPRYMHEKTFARKKRALEDAEAEVERCFVVQQKAFREYMRRRGYDV